MAGQNNEAQGRGNTPCLAGNAQAGRPLVIFALMRRFLASCFLITGTALAPMAAVGQADSNAPPLLVILRDTGTQRDGLPVLMRATDAPRYLDALQAGYSGRLLRLYRCVQSLRFNRAGTPIEPAYLALTKNEGGFPRFGFWLDDAVKRDVAYIDLHSRSQLSGRFGAMDQIFPHELTHVIMHQLAGEAPAGGANQMHAIGVRTDPQTAFNEGFAEAVQVLAVDDPDSLPATRALKAEPARAQRAEAQLADYRRALTARWAPAPRAWMTFPVWFSQTEQLLRYQAVKANRFALEPPVPPRLLAGPDVYGAYLLENVLPGDQPGARKSPGRMLATEGVVSALFARWIADPALQAGRRPEAFYAPFGVKAADLAPVENACLKLFHVLDRAKPHDAAALARAYREAFPDETPAVERVMREIGFDSEWRPSPELWLANDDFKTGTTLFDQFRGLPRTHTFDLNAASVVDLMSVKGMTRPTATAILRGAPYASLAELRRVPEVGPDLAAGFARMDGAMQKLRAAGAEESGSLGKSAILKPYAYRAAVWLAVTALLAAGVYVRARRVRWWRAALNGLTVALLGLGAAWSSDALGGAIAWLSPVAVFGVPAALWQLVRRKPAAAGARVLAAWGLAALVPFLATRAWF
jgi:DNA uptake protein ComE-like DNA-binding protein